MTCIVGLAEGDSVWIGGDSAGVAGLDLTIRADQKVFVNRGFAMGFTTSFRMGQLLRWKFTPPLRDRDSDLEKYMVNEFVDGVRSTLKQGGWARKKDEQEHGGNFLVGHAGRLFEIEGDYQVGEAVRRYAAVGCGYAYALGALASTEGLSPEERVTHALEVAAEFSAGVSPPFHVVNTEGGGDE